MRSMFYVQFGKTDPIGSMKIRVYPLSKKAYDRKSTVLNLNRVRKRPEMYI